MIRKPLSVAQREGIRASGDGQYDSIPNRTRDSLERRGLMREDGTLTKAGVTALNNILWSGDGPEALKEKLRFGARHG